jgi:heat shock protein HslJ
MGTHLRAVAVFAVTLALAAAGCSDDTASDSSASGATTSSPTATPDASDAAVTTADLDGASYVSTHVTGHDLVADTQIRLAFASGSLSTSAGCNVMSGPYDVDGGVVRWTGPAASTMMACSDELTAQDAWLTQLFTDGAEVAVDGSTLTLTSDQVTIEFAGNATTD